MKKNDLIKLRDETTDRTMKSALRNAVNIIEKQEKLLARIAAMAVPSS